MASAAARARCIAILLLLLLATGADAQRAAAARRGGGGGARRGGGGFAGRSVGRAATARGGFGARGAATRANAARGGFGARPRAGTRASAGRSSGATRAAPAASRAAPRPQTQQARAQTTPPPREVSRPREPAEPSADAFARPRNVPRPAASRGGVESRPDDATTTDAAFYDALESAPTVDVRPRRSPGDFDDDDDARAATATAGATIEPELLNDDPAARTTRPRPEAAAAAATTTAETPTVDVSPDVASAARGGTKRPREVPGAGGGATTTTTDASSPETTTTTTTTTPAATEVDAPSAKPRPTLPSDAAAAATTATPVDAPSNPQAQPATQTPTQPQPAPIETPKETVDVPAAAIDNRPRPAAAATTPTTTTPTTTPIDTTPAAGADPVVAAPVQTSDPNPNPGGGSFAEPTVGAVDATRSARRPATSASAAASDVSDVSDVSDAAASSSSSSSFGGGGSNFDRGGNSNALGGGANANANANANTNNPFFFVGGGRAPRGGRPSAPRGFRGGGVEREPSCAANVKGGGGDAPDRPSAPRRERDRVIVRFRPKFSAERFREARRVVEARRPKAAAGKGEGASDVAEFFTALHAAEAASPSPSTGRHRRLLLLGGGGGGDDDDDDDDDALSYRPSLRAAAPAFRVAVLDGASAADRDAFLREYEDDIESFETDVEMRAFDVDVDFDSDANANANAPGPVMRAACPYSQTSLTDAQWNLDRATYEQMQMPNAASISPATISRLDGAYDPPDCLCGRGVHVYSLDTGVGVTHEDFTPHGRVESGWNFVGCDGKVFDASGHGTHVAATAVGATSGIAKCASLTPVQILDGEGRGSSSDVLSALDWVLEREIPPGHRKVVSMSVGGPRSEAVNAAVRDLTSLGVVVVAAAGNEREDARGVSPASEPTALTVGSTACRVAKTDGARCAGDAMSPFSNYGPVVDVFAPGSDVRSAWKTSDASYRVVSGTSMAAPLVAGAAALYLEKYPTASVEDVARAATQTATALNGVEGEGSGGGGGGGRVLNLPAMLARAPPSGGGGGGG